MSCLPHWITPWRNSRDERAGEISFGAVARQHTRRSFPASWSGLNPMKLCSGFIRDSRLRAMSVGAGVSFLNRWAISFKDPSLLSRRETYRRFWQTSWPFPSLTKPLLLSTLDMTGQTHHNGSRTLSCEGPNRISNLRGKWTAYLNLSGLASRRREPALP